jgi:hypothetical protein
LEGRQEPRIYPTLDVLPSACLSRLLVHRPSIENLRASVSNGVARF